ncbi:MAG: hypothetical protein AB1348_04045, partial [Nitrospirota bacterium]
FNFNTNALNTVTSSLRAIAKQSDEVVARAKPVAISNEIPRFARNDTSCQIASGTKSPRNDR